MPKAVLDIRGRRGEWGVTADMPMKQIEAMRADGIEVGILENTIPAWVVACGLTRPWCFVQDVFNFKNPFRQ